MIDFEFSQDVVSRIVNELAEAEDTSGSLFFNSIIARYSMP